MSTDRTRTLVEAAGNGDGNAMDELVARHLPRLHAYVRLQMGEGLRAQEGSEDLVQSVCREVLGDLDRFEYRGEGSFLHWLFSSALNKMRNRAKFQSRQKRDAKRRVPLDTDASLAYSDLATPSQELMNEEAIDRLERTFDRLPEHYREVITLTKIAGVPYEEVATILDKKPAAMRVLLGRAMRRLATELARENG